MVHIQTFGYIPSLLFYLGRYFFSALVSYICILEKSSVLDEQIVSMKMVKWISNELS